MSESSRSRETARFSGGLAVHGRDDFLVGVNHKQSAQSQAGQLRNQESPPDVDHFAGLAQQPGRRQQNHQLTGHRDVQTEQTVAQSLEHRAEDDINARQQEVEGDDPQRRHTDGQHGLAGRKDGQDLVGQQLEDGKADQHNALGVEDGSLDGLFDPVGFAGAVVVADDGHHAVVQAEDGHKHKALELEVDAKDGHCRGREDHQDLVHQEGHDAAHALHGNAGDADGVDPLDGPQLGTEAPHGDLNVMVLILVEVQAHARAAELADDGGHRRAGGTGEGLAAIAEDEDGVQHNIDHGAHQLVDHAVLGAAGGGQQLFHHGRDKQALAEDAADGQIAHALLNDSRILGLGLKIGPHAGKADDHKHQAAANRQEDAVLRGPVGQILIFLTQALGQQGIDAHAGAHAHRNHDVLERESQRDGRQGVLAHVGDENGVHHVVQGLHQHGDHHRDAEFD